jgi:DivIVA domain-containing protein
MPDHTTAALQGMVGSNLPARRDPEFKPAMRGYDRVEVDAYVAKLRREIEELQATRSPEGAVRRALEQVGDEVAGILQRAHDTAAEITMSARREADELLEVARRDSEEMTARAETRLQELDVDTEAIWAERDRIIGDARDLARQLLEVAEAAAERFPPDEADDEATAEIRLQDIRDDDTLGFGPESD